MFLKVVYCFFFVVFLNRICVIRFRFDVFKVVIKNLFCVKVSFCFFSFVAFCLADRRPPLMSSMPDGKEEM